MRHIFCIFGQHVPARVRRLAVEGRPTLRDDGLFQCLRCGWLYDEMRPTTYNYWYKPRPGDVVTMKGVR